MTDAQVISIILSIIGLIFGLGCLGYIGFLQKDIDKLTILAKKLEESDKISKKIIIDSCGCIYPIFSNEKSYEVFISGKEFVSWVKDKYNITDDLQAVGIIKNSNEEHLVELYIKENFDKLNKKEINI